jgi:hypothetical protein
MPFLSNGLGKHIRTFLKSVVLILWRSAKLVGYSRSGEVAAWLCRFDQLPNHESPFTDFSPILADEINRGAGITIH